MEVNFQGSAISIGQIRSVAVALSCACHVAMVDLTTCNPGPVSENTKQNQWTAACEDTSLFKEQSAW